MIKTETGIETGGQTLKFQKSDGSVIELEDDKNLGIYGVAPRLTLHLSIANLIILVKYKKGGEEKQYTVWLNGTDTVATLKQKINNCSGIEVEGQTLKLKYSGGSVEIEDDKQLIFYGLENKPTIDVFYDGTVPKSTIYLSTEKIQILVKYKKVDEEKQYTVWVDTVSTLKQKIRVVTGIETEEQTLKFQKSDGSVTELEDVKELVFYGVVPKSIIHLSTDKFIILVKYIKAKEEKQYTVWVNGTNTVKTLKQKIMALMQNEYKMLFEDIGLSFSPTVEATVKAKDRLNDNSKTMEEYGINEGKVIYILHAFEQRPLWYKIREKSRFEFVYYNNIRE
ncbi:hypothetical protein niasHT_026133 [Heterodera trifolii]|uniref:Ubiquitin-like domain-containing protein n=1 Tax=Heterodera trifolii TaxID=157864 RepID=A0ABD2K049_9BILA